MRNKILIGEEYGPGSACVPLLENSGQRLQANARMYEAIQSQAAAGIAIELEQNGLHETGCHVEAHRLVCCEA